MEHLCPADFIDDRPDNQNYLDFSPVDAYVAARGILRARDWTGRFFPAVVGQLESELGGDLGSRHLEAVHAAVLCHMDNCGGEH